MTHPQLSMFLVSDAVNFGDIVLDLLNKAAVSTLPQHFAGNIFSLHMGQNYTLISNFLDEKSRIVVVSNTTLKEQLLNVT